MSDDRMIVPTNWTFETAEVANHFDRHVREQLPWYDMVTGMVAHVARHYIPDGGLVYDFGASTGNVGRALDEALAERGATLIPVEQSAEMCKLYSGPFRTRLIQESVMDVELEPFDLAVCFLVISFLTLKERSAFMDDLRRHMNPGGAIIVVDKQDLEQTSYGATAIRRMTLAGKVATGTAPEDIVAKELSLGGVQRPLGLRFIQNKFPSACCFFRYGEFSAWLIEEYN